ncbi:hypothetical protein BN1708_006723 [Verticillium longisporum]|uniref:Uncharacterized protein n=1 Tax=Verticillium longisporum TaxID=100787 RepID=A0A0G4MM79_VERLO|nr:hypothetical protein BN1708_006723 [Verticillium longisporum]
MTCWPKVVILPPAISLSLSRNRETSQPRAILLFSVEMSSSPCSFVPLLKEEERGLVSVAVAVAIGSIDLLLGDSAIEGADDVADEVGSVLDTAADADEVVKDTNGLALVAGDAGVGHARRDLDERLDAAEGLGEGEDLGELAEALGGGVAAANAEGEHAAAHGVAVLLAGNVAVGVGVEAGVVDGDDVVRGLEGRGDGRGVARGLAGAEVQRLEAAMGEPRVKSRGDGADGVLEEREAGVKVVRVEGGNAHDNVRVAVDVLCHRVDDNVRAEVERVLDVGGQERVVDDDLDAVLVGLGGDGAHVDETEGRVRGRLDPDELGLRRDVGRDVDLNLGRESDLDAVGLGDLGEVAVGAAVDVRDGDDVRAGGQRLEDDGGGGAAGREGEGVLGLLERSDGRLKVVAVGVVDREMDSMTAPVVGSWGLPAWTARVPKL